MIVVMGMEIVEVMHIVRSKVRSHKRRPLFKLQLMNSVSCISLNFSTHFFKFSDCCCGTNINCLNGDCTVSCSGGNNNNNNNNKVVRAPAYSRSNNNNNNNFNPSGQSQSSSRGSCICNAGFESIADKNGGIQCVG